MRKASIYGGINEIQRNLIARMVLGLRAATAGAVAWRFRCAESRAPRRAREERSCSIRVRTHRSFHPGASRRPAAGGGDPQGALPVIEAVAERAVAALCAEAVGAMDALVRGTAEYLRTRKQFGRPIGAFQVLQHQLADMWMASEEARSMTYVATLRIDDPDPGRRAKAISGAKHLIGRHGRLIGQRAVQLHGGMGMTEEMSVGHYFKRLAMIDVMFGDEAYHLKRYAGL